MLGTGVWTGPRGGGGVIVGGEMGEMTAEATDLGGIPAVEAGGEMGEIIIGVAEMIRGIGGEMVVGEESAHVDEMDGDRIYRRRYWEDL